MRAIISVTFCDTRENMRAGATILCLTRLMRQVKPPHVIAAVDNGSTDLTAWTWVQSWPRLEGHRIEEPMSIAQGVNTGWRPYEDELMRGDAVAIKFDSDMIVTSDDWVDVLLGILESDVGEIGLIGPYIEILGPPQGEDRNGWVLTPFLHGAVAARSPAAFRAIGYCKQPHGRWGWGDHWDVYRVHVAGLKCATVPTLMTRALTGHGVFSRAEKEPMRARAREALVKMISGLYAGTISPFQPYDGA